LRYTGDSLLFHTIYSFKRKLLYQGALDLPKNDPASAIEALIRTNDWGKELLKRLRDKNRIARLLPFSSPRHKQVN
jgi:hypothetical protein